MVLREDQDGWRSFEQLIESIQVANPSSKERATRESPKRRLSIQIERTTSRRASIPPFLGNATKPLPKGPRPELEPDAQNGRAAFRNARSSLPMGRRACSSLSVKPLFFLGFQGFLEGSWMDAHFETLSNPIGQFARLQLGMTFREFLKVLTHRRRQLVRFFGPRLGGEQSLQSSLFKLVGGLVKSRAGQPKFPGGPADGVALMLESAQTLVFELRKISGIEKLRLLEQRVAHLIGAGIKGSGGL